MRYFNRAIDLFEKYSITLAFAVATLLLFSNVVLRYVFNTGMTWVLETVQYLFAWVVLIGAAHGVKVGIHLGIDLLVEKLPPALRKASILFSVLLCLVFVGIVNYESFIYIIRIRHWGDLTQDLQIPQWIPYLSIPIGLSLMFYHFLFIGWQIFTDQRQTIHTNHVPQSLEELEK
ncbi:MAG: TRAP transporter small permease [Gammaproteobacteria bacterium]|nr:MAG: TRAP transporter small permease [Gammaproteobacteria bacterium]